MSRAAVFVALTGVLAASLAVLAALLASHRGLDVNIWLTTATAMVVGLFVAFLWLGPRDHPGPDGFQVVGRRRSGPLQAQQDEPEAQGPPPTEPEVGAPADEPASPNGQAPSQRPPREP